MAFVIGSHSDKILKFFSYLIVFHGLVVCAYFVSRSFPAPEAITVSDILQMAIRVLYILSHAAVLAVVHSLGRKKLFVFLAFQLSCSILISIAISLVSTPFHYKIVFVVNSLLGFLYIGTLLSIRRTPFNYIFICLASSHVAMILIFYIFSLLSLPYRRIFLLTDLLPLIFLFLLVQKTRQHLAKTELETAFLEEPRVQEGVN